MFLNNFLNIKEKINEQHSANSSCKTSLYSDAFRLTVVDLFRVFYKLKLNAKFKS